ncbi:uncharacterized protein LOC142973715 [Anticarsia gemmatalis]|uniref:uncharacterized protein LOC142973715 n=1 Tax=Anticarsia gemmatalis TaxID=129554 RepID=UPI003F773630
MDTLALLVGVLLCLAVVNARSFDDRRDTDPLLEAEDEGVKKHGAERHRRRRWQMNYGYDYPPPIHTYYPERREYDRNQQDLLPKIVKLLEEISVYVKRPQPPPSPPQPIYIPYPVPYPVPQYGPCTPTNTNVKKPNITSRFPEMEDTNQNWGFVLNEDENDDSDGSRPISFDPIKPLRPMKRPAPKVEHGSLQAESSAPHTTQAPRFDEVGMGRAPVMCNAAILSCCAGDKPQQQACFSTFGCGPSYDNGNACSNDAINEALEAFKSAYSPMP